MALFSFDAESVDPGISSFDSVPVGNYVCQVIDSALKDTSTGGQLLTLTLEIMDGPHARRRVWDNLNIRNSNAQAQEIAQRQLSQLCLALGVRKVTDTAQLHGKPVRAKIGIQPARDQYPEKNVVKAYAAAGSAPAAFTPSAQAAAPAARPAGAAKKPWEKG